MIFSGGGSPGSTLDHFQGTIVGYGAGAMPWNHDKGWLENQKT
jgi:hypothetical protein